MELHSSIWYNAIMKVWIKYLIGIVLGVLAAFVLPLDNAKASEFLSFLVELFVRFGRYLVVPLVFSTAIVSINKLRTSKLILKTFLWAFIIIVVSSLLLTLLGIVSISMVKLPRIPITIEAVSEDKLEVICNIDIVKRVIKTIREVHPYEEPSIDIVPLIDEEDL